MGKRARRRSRDEPVDLDALLDPMRREITRMNKELAEDLLGLKPVTKKRKKMRRVQKVHQEE